VIITSRSSPKGVLISYPAYEELKRLSEKAKQLVQEYTQVLSREKFSGLGPLKERLEILQKLLGLLWVVMAHIELAETFTCSACIPLETSRSFQLRSL